MLFADAKVLVKKGYFKLSFVDEAGAEHELVLSLPSEDADYINLEICALTTEDLDLELTHHGSQVIAYSNGWKR